VFSSFYIEFVISCVYPLSYLCWLVYLKLCIYLRRSFFRSVVISLCIFVSFVRFRLRSFAFFSYVCIALFLYVFFLGIPLVISLCLCLFRPFFLVVYMCVFRYVFLPFGRYFFRCPCFRYFVISACRSFGLSFFMYVCRSLFLWFYLFCLFHLVRDFVSSVFLVMV